MARLYHNMCPNRYGGYYVSSWTKENRMPMLVL